MRLKYLTIKNFRGIDELTKLELSNLNTFVGKNDSGKSVIVRRPPKWDSKEAYFG